MLEKSVAINIAFLSIASVAAARPPAWEPSQPALEELGKQVFFDPISQPGSQSCASCHVSESGWTGASSFINATQVAIPGADPRTAGNRKPPTISYASFAPTFGDFPGRICTADSSALSCWGGLFWDGRATGSQIGSEVFAGDKKLEAAFSEFLGPTADQAMGPFANDVEMNVPDGNDDGLPGAEFVCRHVKRASYARLFKEAFGKPIACDSHNVAVSFKRIALAISAFEHSAEVNSFSSRRDIALAEDDDNSPGMFPLAGLSDLENLGHDLFFGVPSALNPEGKNARCSACHNSEGAGAVGDEPGQLYTDHRFHHLGLPPNYEAANFDPDAPDFGLSQHTDPTHAATSPQAGHFRTTSLRNVDKRPSKHFVKAYMHNGYFKSLEDVVHFYNTALLKLDPESCPPGTTAAQARARDCWPAPEVDNGRQSSLVGLFGDLGLSDYEEAALVAYMKTLSDTETVSAPRSDKKKAAKRADGKEVEASKGRGLPTWLLWLFGLA